MEGTDSRHWEDLLPDALGLIFHNLSLQEKLTVIPRVCKPWSKAVMGPYCWQEIDIEEWSNRSESGDVDRMLRMLITRSSGSLRKLCVSGLQNENIFDFIAEHARSLQTLRLPRSEMCDSTMEKIAGRLSILTFLDVSYCSKIGPRALEAIGKNCKFLERLRRNMHPLDVEGKLLQNNEAYAIATTMPKLKHLEIAYHVVDTIGVLEIITSCRELEFLDLRGCWDVKFDEKYLKDKFPKLNVLGPHVVDQYEKNAWEDCSDYSDSLYDDYESSDGMWDDDESLELRFYGGYDEASVYGWPPSP
ncbi:F-box protein FBW2 isoform X1 [Coffea eugenioides]|uniref:F-box protein FBW2 isoform X1 n=1 Tax=Coffea eugenioides TaxID=49369 RepID=UPI000F608817|nr:F-box protein FBW2 isoform X1 [Coffea eugenioides]XP_027148897.1 F-box protein FBW2 isoform X1 [Coffea eugenioides]XP_027148898.1 F-box protein FBW2 isoform X1 [Coffea eugenioides]XP_027148899.1 F-box protein FBW2 isoform X1 [Coffea eugenioides]XP_027148900.1 F-box protein FBW2 isoform X1 [Coffea eugenioides]XP_027148901.1 F-box protein FBW2 isoform X1 [Coffea eugenioides]XP_027148903.1 F-box protein FBW2 isoform X1 [Coffea eugenioides]XP_027148904.1 F-box protein FBW2 isoform X1 [Coffea 